MYKHSRRLLVGVIALLETAGAVAQVAPGETTDDTQARGRVGLETVVVTARKRAESQQDVPVAISSITPTQLESNIATDLSKVAELAPQVMIGRNTNGTGGFLTIRGISSSGTDAGLDQSVAVSIDGVPLSRGRVINSSVYDIAQVEVLAGPQSLFFGKNSPAGVISLRSGDPTDHFEGSVKAGYEMEAEERYVEGMVSGPISDTFSARLAFRGSAMNGWIDNVAQPVADPLHPGVTVPGATFGNKGPDGENYSGRLTLRWEPSSDFNANLKVTWDKQSMNAMNAYVELYCTGGQTVPTIAGIAMPYADCAKNQRKAEASLPAVYAVNYPYGNNGLPYYDSKFVLGALTLNKEFDKVSLTSTTGYYDQTVTGGNNADYTPFSLLWSTQHEDYDLFTQEVRVNTEFDGPLNFMGGLYYEKSRRPWFNAADLFHGGFNVMAQNWTTFETAAKVDSESYSGFAQLRWNITDALELAAGARYTHEEKDGDFENLSIGVTTLNLRPVGDVLHSSYDDDNVSPEVTLTWHPAPDQTIYGAYKTGFKSGGLSNGAILQRAFTADSVKFGPEESKGFEIGYKSTLLQDTLRLDVTAYRYEYDGLQVASFDSSTLSFNIGNAAEARTEGVAGSFNWLATDNLSFNGNVGYNRARYTNYRTAPCYAGQTAALGCVGGSQDLSGTALVRAPDVTFSIGADYRAQFTAGWIADFSIDAAHSDSYQAHTDNHPGGIQDAFWRLNAAINLMPDDERFKLSLIGRNLTNEYYMIASSSAPGGPPTQFVATFNRPREVVLQAEYNF
ncbi:TonB-dependent receptor [Steroidobacter flavus]|uniref:TonB-dependent receptor n=1 Tax=Steroidobacter flavus TaxID=1842136 RepID=A0ABV8T1M9_9GAMM